MSSHFEILDYQNLREDHDWWMIYYYSFAAEERESELVILKSVATGTGMAFAAKDGNLTKGIATVHLLKEIGTIFLVYLAILPSERGKGIGSRFFRFIEKSATKKLENLGLEPLGMVWEVQKSEFALDNHSNESDLRRAFFEKNGGSLLSSRYVQPPVDGISFVEMDLMVKPKGLIHPHPNALVEAMYYDKYHGVNEIDKETLDRLLRSIMND
ncbi:GNAT family N-acetyltransferase [Desertivirga brevis]|uniref:GNAT family N-acetyltransferase n=1 Tax=Desertivirga brevis TaxID=2810310 RepID=UPI001A95DBF1|nr:GNAT family N-acetyltransferase [Pedobacter sp. SYSU D00873]